MSHLVWNKSDFGNKFYYLIKIAKLNLKIEQICLQKIPLGEIPLFQQPITRATNNNPLNDGDLNLYDRFLR